MPFELTSPAFSSGGLVPRKYTCDGEDVSPPLQWSGSPENAVSFALICDDPDAPFGTWIHWVLYNLPAGTKSLSEGISKKADLSDGSREGRNSWGAVGYGGPCPPGGTHRYFFKLYALDKMLDLAAGASERQLLEAMKGHIIAQTELMGRYSR